MKCDQCHYWRASEANASAEPEHGHCHRHPPVQILSAHEGPNAKRDANAWVFPVVYSSSWCGDFNAAEKSGMMPG